MDDQVKMAIIDFMNLVFGDGQETEEFWNTILLPYVSQYYNYPMDDLLRAPKHLNALFFAFSSHFGLRISKQVALKTLDQTMAQGGSSKYQGSQQQQLLDDDYFKKFGKSSTPFGQPDRTYSRIEILGKTRTYGLRNLSYKMLADKYREYRAEGKIENALKCCKMKRLLRKLLD